MEDTAEEGGSIGTRETKGPWGMAHAHSGENGKDVRKPTNPGWSPVLVGGLDAWSERALFLREP